MGTFGMAKLLIPTLLCVALVASVAAAPYDFDDEPRSSETDLETDNEPSDLQQLDEPSGLDDLDLLDRGDDEMKEYEDEADDAVEEEKMRDDSDEPVDVDGDAEDDDLMDYGF